ncbi:MAG: MFS transporter [Acidobacteria bacterium]|nr:MFS transporter [Acidobacteriota bacterium]
MSSAPTGKAPPPSAPAAGPATAPLPPPRHPLAIPHFRNLWIGVTISVIGDQFYLVALPWLVLQLTGSSLALGTVMMTTAIPRAGLMLVGGAMIDRFSVRRVLIVTATIRALLVGAVAALVWLRAIGLWHVYLLTFAFGVADAFSLPAGLALIPTLVEPRQLQPANAALQSSAVMAQMVGPAPAGLLIRSFGVAPALLCDALSFLAALAAVLGLPQPPAAPAAAAGSAARPSTLHAIGEGLRAVRQDRPLLSLLGVFAVLNFCIAGPLFVGLPAMARLHFGSAAAFGTFLTCFGGGTLVGLAAAGMVKRPRRRGLQIIAMSCATGLELIAIGLVGSAAAIGTLLALMGVGVGVVNVQFGAWIQARVDRAILGRVSSVLMFCAVGLVPVSYAVAGALAAFSFAALFAGAGAVLAATAVLAVSSGAARRID